MSLSIQLLKLPRYTSSRLLHSIPYRAHSLSHFDVYGRYGRPDRIASDGTFETVSTIPAATSFQEIPTSSAATLQTPVPAMKDASTSASFLPAKDLIVEGVHVPPRPKRPGGEECCMSGCAYCVYDIYAEELETYNEATKEAKAKLEAKGVPVSQWPEQIRPKGQAGTQVVEEALDPVMAAFLALEKKIKKKQAPESSGATL